MGSARAIWAISRCAWGGSSGAGGGERELGSARAIWAISGCVCGGDGFAGAFRAGGDGGVWLVLVGRGGWLLERGVIAVWVRKSL